MIVFSKSFFLVMLYKFWLSILPFSLVYVRASDRFMPHRYTAWTIGPIPTTNVQNLTRKTLQLWSAHSVLRVSGSIPMKTQTLPGNNMLIPIVTLQTTKKSQRRRNVLSPVAGRSSLFPTQSSARIAASIIV